MVPELEDFIDLCFAVTYPLLIVFKFGVGAGLAGVLFLEFSCSLFFLSKV